MKQVLKIASVIGLRRSLYYSLCLDLVRDWLLQIWFCHHNARVLSEMEWRLSCVLDHCTGTMSKPYYSLEAMRTEIDRYVSDRCDEAVAEARAEWGADNS